MTAAISTRGGTGDASLFIWLRALANWHLTKVIVKKTLAGCKAGDGAVAARADVNYNK